MGNFIDSTISSLKNGASDFINKVTKDNKLPATKIAELHKAQTLSTDK